MPSRQHETLLMLFRNRPELAATLLGEVLDVPLPEYAEAKVESAELTDVVPTEYRADLVVLLLDGKPVLGIVVEVQLKPDRRKRFSWPVYAMGLRARLECPCCVLVVSPIAATAAWARTPIETGPGSRFAPFVLGAGGGTGRHGRGTSEGVARASSLVRDGAWPGRRRNGGKSCAIGRFRYFWSG